VDEDKTPLEPFREGDVARAIKKLNPNKSSDEFGHAAEHLKYGVEVICPALTMVFNEILTSSKSPESFKSGIITPVLKRDKDPALVNNYRGITVTAVIGKTFENCLLEKLNLVNESELQFGFTKGLFPLIAGLLMSKAKYEILQVQKTLFIGLFDVQSAFDVVQHIILMDKLFNQKIPLALWSIIDDMYSGLTTRVKWKGELSNTYPVWQGVRQGRLLSTHLYKIFVQDLLLELEENSLGYHLGNVYIGTPTCADDVAIIERDSNNLQIMINVISRYAKQHHYKINPLKTRILDCSKHPSVDQCWEMNDIDIKHQIQLHI
jgi:hypothetical protein